MTVKCRKSPASVFKLNKAGEGFVIRKTGEELVIRKTGERINETRSPVRKKKPFGKEVYIRENLVVKSRRA